MCLLLKAKTKKPPCFQCKNCYRTVWPENDAAKDDYLCFIKKLLEEYDQPGCENYMHHDFLNAREKGWRSR